MAMVSVTRSRRHAECRRAERTRRDARSTMCARVHESGFRCVLVVMLAAVGAALSLAAAPAPVAAAETYQYDALDRLTQVTYSNGSLWRYTYDNAGRVLSIVSTVQVEGVIAPPKVPPHFALEPIAPNPGTGARVIAFSIPAGGRAQLRVFDAAGRAMVTPLDGDIPAGRYTARVASNGWAPGTYFIRLTYEGRTLDERMTVVR